MLKNHFRQRAAALKMNAFFGAMFALLVGVPFVGFSNSSVIQGKIAEIHPAHRWLSVDSSQGFLFLVLHPQAFIFKDGRKSSLTAFHKGEMIAAVPGGIRNKNTVLILALEDWKTYAVEAHLVSIALHLKSYKTGPVVLPPPAQKFQQLVGKISDLQPSLKMFLIRTTHGKDRVVWIGKKTKIYTFSKKEFILYSFRSLLKGEWVQVGGFPFQKGVKAESVYIFKGVYP